MVAQTLSQPISDVGLLYCLLNIVRKSLSREIEPQIGLVVSLNFIPLFAQLLRNVDNVPVRMEIAWAVTNIAASKSEYVALLRTTGIHYTLVSLLPTQDHKEKEQVLFHFIP